jgi:hypothetical protein
VRKRRAGSFAQDAEGRARKRRQQQRPEGHVHQVSHLSRSFLPSRKLSRQLLQFGAIQHFVLDHSRKEVFDRPSAKPVDDLANSPNR